MSELDVVRDAVKAVADARTRAHEAIQAAYDAGYPLVKIAEAAGISKSQAHRIVQGQAGLP